MTDRDMSAAALAELAADQNRPVHLVEVYFDSGTLYLTDAYRSVGFNGSEYVSQGHFLTFEGLEETLAFQVNAVTVSLSGADQARTWPALVLQQEWTNRRLVIRRAFLLDGGQVVSDPVVIFDGLMDDVDVTDDPLGKPPTTVTVRASNQFADFGRRAGRRTNDSEQQQFFSGDRFFQFTAEQNRTIYWGGRRHSAAFLQRFSGSRQRGDDPGGD